jgi:hypothetical protein
VLFDQLSYGPLNNLMNMAFFTFLVDCVPFRLPACAQQCGPLVDACTALGTSCLKPQQAVHCMQCCELNAVLYLRCTCVLLTHSG